jgi:NAD-dependent DNA ligase adenylation domain
MQEPLSKYKYANGEPVPIRALILQRRRQLIVHSFGYYRMNDNIVSDHTFDRWSNELVELQRDYPEIAKEVDLWEYFEDWDGSTGYHLPTHLPWVADVWEKIKRYHRRDDK